MPEADAVAAPEVDDRAGLQEIKSLLTDLGIKHVIFVDDAFDEASTEDATQRLIVRYDLLKIQLQDYAVKNPKLSAHLDILIEGELADDEAVIAELRSRGADLPDEIRAELLALIVNEDDSASSKDEDDARSVVNLEPMLQGVAQYHPVKASEWNQRRAELLGEGHDTTLVFFDRNLGSFGGERGGESLLSAVSAGSTSSTYIGLFTRDAVDALEEIKIAEPLIAQTNEAVSVMGKYRLSSPALFAEGLRVFLYARDVHAIRRHTAAALRTALGRAEEFLTGLGLYSLLTASMAAHREGLHETDGPLRMINAELRRSLESEMRSNPPHEAVARIRGAFSRKLRTGLEPSAPIAQLAWNEKFDSAEHLATNYRPLEAGDIFEITFQDGREGHYVLLVQACDLIIRTDGKRTNAPPSFVLAQLRAAPGPLADLGSKYFPIGQYSRVDASEEWVVDLTQKILLGPEILDACVLSSDGRAILKVGASIPAGLTRGWERRASRLEAWRSTKVAQASALSALLPSRMSKKARALLSETLHVSVLGPGFEGGGVRGTVDPVTGEIEVSITRVAHLVEGHSRALLIVASQHQARPDRDGPLFHDPTPTAETR